MQLQLPLLILVFTITFSKNSFARVYLPNERFFSESVCVPRLFCNIMKNYVLTEPQLIRPILQGYQRLSKEKEVWGDFNDIEAFLFYNSAFSTNRSSTVWTVYDGIGFESETETNNLTNTWGLNLRWTPFNFTGLPTRDEGIDAEMESFFYLARLRVYNLLDPFLQYRSPQNIFFVIKQMESLGIVNFAIPLVKEFFKKQMFLYKQKLTPMEDVLEIYKNYNNLLNKKIGFYNGIHDYAPQHIRLKNFVKNSIDALALEFQDMVEEKLNLDKLNICTKRSYLEESSRRQIYNLKISHETMSQRFINNLSGFNLNLGGPVNEPMNLTTTVSFNFAYQLFESPQQSMLRWDYIIARKNISDDLTKSVEMEEVMLNEKFLRTRALKENYLQRKENREQVYLLLRGKIINRLGDENFKFGFNTITQKTNNLMAITDAEIAYVKSLFDFGNSLFLSLSQCPLSEEIVDSLENM